MGADNEKVTLGTMGVGKRMGFGEGKTESTRGWVWLGWKGAETTQGLGHSYGHTVFRQAGPHVFVGQVQLGIPDLNALFQGSQLLPELLQCSLGLRARKILLLMLVQSHLDRGEKGS